jgi:conjugative relaxase-like TrwC/TraI family protein
LQRLAFVAAGKDADRRTGNIVAALFQHETSRALDPHLHTHCIVFNATHDAEEGRWKALQNYEMLTAQKYAENVVLPRARRVRCAASVTPS